MAADGNTPGTALPVTGLELPHHVEHPWVFGYDQLWQHREPLLDVLKTLYGDRQLDSFGGSYGWSVRYRQVEDYEAINLHTLGDYIDAFRCGDIKLPYLRHLSINRAMPELRQHIQLPEQFRPNWVTHPLLDRLGGPELFIGQARTTFGHLHQDQVSVHVGFVQLQGAKEFVLFPPDDAEHLETFEGREFPYQLRNSRIRYVDLYDKQRFPGLHQARMQRITLRAGQALFLPADWWHTTYNLSDSVSYSIRIVNSSNALQTLQRHIEGIPRWLRKLASH